MHWIGSGNKIPPVENACRFHCGDKSWRPRSLSLFWGWINYHAITSSIQVNRNGPRVKGENCCPSYWPIVIATVKGLYFAL